MSASSSSSSVQTFEQFGKTLFEISTQVPVVAMKTVDKVTTSALKTIKQNAPEDTGKLKRETVRQQPSSTSYRITSKPFYAIYVDKGHKTRQGTGRAPGYRPKPGGITHIPPTFYFSSVIDQLKQGGLEKALQENIQAVFNRKAPAYREVRISKTTGKRYYAYKKKGATKGRVGGRSTLQGGT